MKNRYLEFFRSYALLLAWGASAIYLANPMQETAKRQNQEQTAYFDIDYFLSGQQLAVALAGETPATARPPFAMANPLPVSTLRYPVNLAQLQATNAVDERILRKSRMRMQQFADQLPLLVSSNEGNTFLSGKDKSEVQVEIEKLIELAKQHKGTRYRYGGTQPGGFDCSGFTSYAFQQLGLKLPRTSHSQSKLGTTVPLAEAQPGDMVFFGRKRGNSYSTNHTGIVVENNNGRVRIIHSTRRGVVIDEVMGIQSYSRRFLFVKRVF